MRRTVAANAVAPIAVSDAARAVGVSAHHSVNERRILKYGRSGAAVVREQSLQSALTRYSAVLSQVVPQHRSAGGLRWMTESVPPWEEALSVQYSRSEGGFGYCGTYLVLGLGGITGWS